MNSTELKNRISDLSNELRNEPLPDLSEEDFSLFEKTGNRVIYEDSYFKRRKMLTLFGLSAILDGNSDNVKKLSEVVKEVCLETTWALPAHCNRVQDPDWKNTVDLFACETAATLALILKEKGNALEESLRSCVIKQIFERVIHPFVRSGKKFGFENATHNWNAVCCGSIGTVLLTVGKEMLEKDEITGTLRRIVSSLETYVESFPKDGACLEGIGYFNYGMSFYTGFARRLKNYDDFSYDLFDNERLRKIAEFPNAAFFSNGMSVNFSDASMSEKVHGGILAAFSKEFDIEYSLPDCSIADFDTDYCYRFLPLLDDVLYGDEIKRKTDGSTELFSYLPEAEWVIDENAGHIGFAVKGGNNDEPHNHNDVGSFIYLEGDNVIACELGAGEYTKDYFAAGRYDILCNSSLGHSLPVVNQKGQKTGKNSRAKDFSVQNEQDILKVSVDITDCYDIPDGSIVKRNFAFDKKTGELLVRDTASGDLSLYTQIVSKKDIANKLDIPDNRFAVKTVEADFSNHSGEKEKIFIYEIKENKDGNCKEGTESREVYGITYRLHP